MKLFILFKFHFEFSFVSWTLIRINIVDRHGRPAPGAASAVIHTHALVHTPGTASGEIWSIDPSHSMGHFDGFPIHYKHTSNCAEFMTPDYTKIQW